MGTLQRVASSLSANASSYGGDAAVSDQFPVGLRVLVVDDDTTCLRILEHMLRRQLYQVTSCSQATVALNILRERKGCFDIVLSDVYMPDMDGYKLLEQVGLEMDLPVIMMSADGSKSAVMRGIIHGACDYLIKPIREEEIKNMWQHVIRKKRNEIKEHEHSGSLEDNDQHKRGSDDVDHASSVNEGTEGVLKCQKKRSSGKEEGGSELESDDPSATKKPRVVWSVELHQQFVSAVNQLGIDKAVPKRILELMNVPGLTRENVASHLQKFRLYLKRLSGVAQCGVSSTFCSPLDPNVKLNSLGQFDLQALAASGQIPQQTLAALHAELLGRSTGSLVTVMDQPAPLHASMQGSKSMPVEHDVKFGQPLVKCQSNISKHFQQNMPPAREVAPRFGVWSSTSLGPLGPSNNLGGMDTQNCNIMMDILQQQKQQRQQLQKQQQRPSLPEPSHSINVQPSCLVVPSQSSSASSQAGNSTASVNQNCSFNGGAIVDYNLLSPQSNSLLNIGNVSDGPIETASVVSGFSVPGSVSPPSSCFINADNGTLQQVQNSTMMFGAARQSLGIASNICDIQGSYSADTGEVLDQGLLKDLGFVGKGTCIPSQFAMNGCESPMSSLNHGKISLEKNVNKVKEEPGVEFLDNARVGLSILPQFPPNDLMDVFSE